MKTLILVGLGGGIGSIFRYLTSVYIAKYCQPVFPLATFITNILGCLIIGVLFGLSERQQLINAELRFLLITGFCGGYTTFSTFALEEVHLLQSDNLLTAFFYIAASNLVALFAVWIGLLLSKL